MSDSFINTYTQPAQVPIHTEITEASYGPTPYDLNFLFPIALDLNPTLLTTPRVRLTPFIPRIHAQTLISKILSYPSLTRYLPTQHKSLPDLLQFLEYVRSNPAWILFSIIDRGTSKERSGQGEQMAGLIGLIRTDAQNMCTEIGHVIIFPEFQRTYVTTNATSILLRYCLELPSRLPGALGLRRVEWRANTKNEPSVRAATRMGFRQEGVLRWQMALPEGKEGDEPREGDPRKERLKRDSALLAVCCDDWEGGLREKVQESIDSER